MKQVTARRLEKLETSAGVNDRIPNIIVSFVGRDDSGKRIVTSGLKITPGKEMEKLPASYFDNEDLQDDIQESIPQKDGHETAGH